MRYSEIIEGLTEDKEEALTALRQLREKLHGEFARD
jgi:hypothetical protein